MMRSWASEQVIFAWASPARESPAIKYVSGEARQTNFQKSGRSLGDTNTLHLSVLTSKILWCTVWNTIQERCLTRKTQVRTKTAMLRTGQNSPHVRDQQPLLVKK